MSPLPKQLLKQIVTAIPRKLSITKVWGLARLIPEGLVNMKLTLPDKLFING